MKDRRLRRRIDYKKWRLYGKTYNTYKMKCMSTNTKFRHYNSVIKLEVLYSTKTFTFYSKSEKENILKEEKNLGKVLAKN